MIFLSKISFSGFYKGGLYGPPPFPIGILWNPKEFQLEEFNTVFHWKDMYFWKFLPISFQSHSNNSKLSKFPIGILRNSKDSNWKLEIIGANA